MKTGMKKKEKAKKRTNEAAEQGKAEKSGGQKTTAPPSPVREGDVWRLHGSLMYARCALLTYDCTFPAPEGEGGYQAIRSFYERLGTAAAEYLTEKLIPATVADYEACTDARARYSFPRVRYLADFRVTQDTDGFFSVRRCSFVLRGGREISRREESEVFSIRRGLVCPVAFLRANGYAFAEEERISKHTGIHLSKILGFFGKRTQTDFYLLEGKIHLLPVRKRPSL
jgi:hypothetical protein